MLSGYYLIEILSFFLKHGFEQQPVKQWPSARKQSYIRRYRYLVIVNEPKLQISLIVSVQNFTTQKYRYCKHIQSRTHSVFLGYYLHICNHILCSFPRQLNFGNCIFGMRNPHFGWIVDNGYKSNLLKKYTFRSLILNFSHALNDSIQARNL